MILRRADYAALSPETIAMIEGRRGLGRTSRARCA
jgi:hypothetical protein